MQPPDPQAPTPNAADGPTRLGGVEFGSPALRRALLFSFFDGLCANVMVSLNETFAVAAAVNLGASNTLISLLGGLPLLLGALAQFLLPSFLDPAGGRKRYVLVGVRLQSALLFAAAFSGWLDAAWAPLWFVATFVLAGVAGNATTAFWMGWMGDLIPAEGRGRHFAWRNTAFAWVYLICSLGAGWLSRSFTSGSAPWIWFAGLFVLSSLARFLSYAFLSRQDEPPTETAIKAPPPWKYRPDPLFLKFCLATALFQGSASMTGPFFNVWYLRDLHWDFLKLSLSAACTILGSILFVRHWGRLADSRGTTAVIRLSGLGIALVPFPYLFLEDVRILLCLNIYAGAFWAGYNLATFNYLLHATDGEKLDRGRRNQNIAFAALLTGFSAFGFSLLGGFLADALPVLNGYRLRSLFLVSTLMRLAICVALFPAFREYQQGLPASSSPLWMEFPGIRAGLGVFRVVYRGFRNQ